MLPVLLSLHSSVAALRTHNQLPSQKIHGDTAGSTGVVLHRPAAAWTVIIGDKPSSAAIQAHHVAALELDWPVKHTITLSASGMQG